MDAGPGYLWGSQWAELDQILRDAGAPPNGFRHTANLTRSSWFGPKTLPVSEQWAELRHHEHEDVWFRFQHYGPTYDEDGDRIETSGWRIKSSPQPDGSPRVQGYQFFAVADFDELKDIATEWAGVATSELRVRGAVAAARTKAEAEWREHAAADRPLELTRLSGFVQEDLPRAVEDGLRRAGVESDGELRQGVAAARAKTADLVSVAADADVRDLPRIFAERVKSALIDKFADRVADIAVTVVVEAVKAHFRLY